MPLVLSSAAEQICPGIKAAMIILNDFGKEIMFQLSKTTNNIKFRAVVNTEKYCSKRLCQARSVADQINKRKQKVRRINRRKLMWIIC